MLTDEQAQNIKSHLLKQLDNFPEDKRQEIKDKILSMTNEEMESFIQENKLDYSKGQEDLQQKCIFCAIGKGEIKSYKIDEDQNYIAILELNPLSKGHSLIIPKKHIELEKINDDSLEFAKRVSDNLLKKLGPREIKISKTEIMTHGILEIIPIFGNEKEKHKATEEELTSLQEELTKQDIEIPEKASPPEPEKLELPKIPLRLKWI